MSGIRRDRPFQETEAGRARQVAVPVGLRRLHRIAIARERSRQQSGYIPLSTSVPQAQSGEVDAVGRLVDLASDPRREEVAARVRRERGRRNEVALEVEREAAVCPVALGPRELRRRLELSIERAIVEIREVGVLGSTDRAAVKDVEDPSWISGKRPSGNGQVERLAASTETGEEIADGEFLHLDVDPERLQVAADDLCLP